MIPVVVPSENDDHVVSDTEAKLSPKLFVRVLANEVFEHDPQASSDRLPFRDEKPLHGPHVGLNQRFDGF